jgi:hypothetical protein
MPEEGASHGHNPYVYVSYIVSTSSGDERKQVGLIPVSVGDFGVHSLSLETDAQACAICFADCATIPVQV